jgi:hypothetical protein
MEESFNSFQMEDNLNILPNGRHLNFWQLEDNINFLDG